MTPIDLLPGSSSPVAISVIVFVSADLATAMPCIDSLSRQRLGEGSFDLLIVHRNPRGVESLLQSSPRTMKGIPLASGGVANALNLAAERAAGRTLLFVDEHVVVTKGMLEVHRAAHMGAEENPVLVSRLTGSTELNHAFLACGSAAAALGVDSALADFSSRCVSMPRALFSAIGRFDALIEDREARDLDLALRIVQAGGVIRALKGAEAVWNMNEAYDSMAGSRRDAIRSVATFIARKPLLLSVAPALLDHGLVSCSRFLASNQERFAQQLTALRELDALKPEIFRRLGQPGLSFNKQVATLLQALVRSLDLKWMHQGLIDGLRNVGARDFTESLRKDALSLGDLGERFTLLVPSPNDLLWQDVLDNWLRTSRDETLVVYSHSTRGLPAPELQALVALQSARSCGSRPHGPVFVLDTLPPEYPDPLVLTGVRTWIATGNVIDEMFVPFARALGVEVQAIPSSADAPWRLPTQRPVRCLAWPDWNDEASIRAVLELSGPLVGLPHVCLVLRHDRLLDGLLALGIERLERAFISLYGASAELDVHIEDQPMTSNDWGRLGRSTDVFLGTPVGAERAALVARTGLRQLRHETQTTAWLQELETLVASQAILKAG